MNKLFTFFAAVLLTACAANNDPQQLQCSIGIADITPSDSVNLAGFAARKGLSNSIHRRLKTHCLVIRNATDTLCLITNDMMEFSPDYSDRLREAIAREAGLADSRIFIHCIHTHSAPRTGGRSAEEGGTNYRFAKMVHEVIVSNAVATIKNGKFQPFTIETGKGSCDMNCNRSEPDGPIDHDVYIARLLDRKGKVIASLLNYSCHPVSLNARSLAVSTDFPGITAEELERDWGGEVLYFSGAQGNVDPCGGLKADTAYTHTKGLMLADACRKVQFKALPASNALKIINKEIRLPFREAIITPELINAHVAEIKQWKVSDTWQSDVDGWQNEILARFAEGKVKNHLPFRIAGVNIGGLFLLLTQGEPFNEYQTELRHSIPDIPILFVAYTNGQNSYLPSKHAFEVNYYNYEKEQMHIYIKAPYPISAEMPAVYSAAVKEIIEAVR